MAVIKTPEFLEFWSIEENRDDEDGGYDYETMQDFAATYWNAARCDEIAFLERLKLPLLEFITETDIHMLNGRIMDRIAQLSAGTNGIY